MRRATRLKVGYALLGVGLVALILGLERGGVLAGWATALQPFLAALAGMGLLGAFLLGLLGNSSVLLQVPYTVPILAAALSDAPLPYLVGLAVAAAVGATAGELVSYGIADQVVRRVDLAPSRLFRWVQGTVTAHPRSIPWLVLLFAVTLLPDDVLLVILAMSSYGAGRIVLPLLLGKMVFCLGCAAAFALLGQQAAQWVTPQATVDVGLLLLVLLGVAIAYQVHAARPAGGVADSVEAPTSKGVR